MLLGPTLKLEQFSPSRQKSKLAHRVSYLKVTILAFMAPLGRWPWIWEVGLPLRSEPQLKLWVL